MIVQPEFDGLVTAADASCRDRFDPRLAAMYLAGSVAAREAWLGASDLLAAGPPSNQSAGHLTR